MKINKDKLVKMTKEQKLKLLDLIQEKKRRDKLRPNIYKPHQGQLKVHTSKCLNRFAVCPNGWGKSALLANEAIWAAEGYNPIHKEYTTVPCRIMVVLDQPAKVAETWLPELRKWTLIDVDTQLHKDGKPYINRISFANGSSIVFAFHDQEPLRFESVELDLVIFDEPMPAFLFSALQRAGRTKGRTARYLFGGTPLGASWIRKTLYEPWVRGERTDVEFFSGATTDNKENLSEGYIERFSAFLSEKEKRIRLYGEWFDLDGLALAHLFKRDTHILEPTILEEFQQNSWPCVVAIDPHPEKKTHAILLGATPENQLVVLKEIALKQTPKDFAQSLKEWSQDFKIVDWVCDNFGSGQFTGGEGFKSFIEVLNTQGLRVRPTTYDEKQDDAFIERIQDALVITEGKGPTLKVVSRCIGTINDIEQVEWQKVKHMDLYKPKLNIGNRDYLACVKYALAARLRFDNSRGRIVSTTGPISWRERNEPGVAQKRAINKGAMKRNYTDRRHRDDEDF